MSFKIHKNILNKKEQKEILSFVKTKVKNFGDNHPGLQSDDNLHTYEKMNIFLNKILKFIKPNTIKTCWVNYSIGNTIMFHPHNSKYNIVYYLFNPSQLGVMFQEKNNTIKHTKGLENSLIIFDNSQLHSAPNSPKKINRYTIALEII